MKQYDNFDEAVKAIFIVVVLIGVGIILLFYTPPERKPKPPKTETFSHKVGDAARQTSAEFLRGFFGMDSKLKKEQEKLEKEKKQINQIQNVKK